MENISPKILVKAQKNLGELFGGPIAFEYAPKSNDAVASFSGPVFESGKARQLEAALSQELGGEVKGQYTQEGKLTGLNFKRDAQNAVEAAGALTPEKITRLKDHIQRLQQQSGFAQGRY